MMLGQLYNLYRVRTIFFIFFTGNQYKIRVMFTGTRIPIHTYGRIHILLIDENGLNETHTLTQ